jgi:uncharacterized membrane protein
LAKVLALPTAVEAAAVNAPCVALGTTTLLAWVPTEAYVVFVVPATGVLMPVSPPASRPPPAGGFTTGGFTTGGFTTGGFTTGGFTTGGFTTGGFTTGGFTVPVEPPPIPTEVEPTVTGAVIGMIT